MALKPASDHRLDAQYAFTVVQVTPKRDGLGDSAPQKTTAEGTPVWTVDALRSADGGTDIISVTVPAATQPQVAGPASFKGLRLGLWLGERSKQGGLFWAADSVQPAQQPRREG